ncbi:MAG: GAF domain-containing protein [Calditrichaeota bacterium]|nr:MAG: GAF domain-containing protein [Calditrichota bacterium]
MFFTKYKKVFQKSIFSELSEEEFNSLEPSFKEKEYKAGEVLFEEGDTGNVLFLLIEGKLKISKRAESKNIAIEKVINEGELVGEMAVLEKRPRSASVFALTDVKVLLIEEKKFLNFAGSNPGLAIKLSVKLSRRIRRTDEDLVEMIAQMQRKLNKSINRFSSILDISKEINSSLDLNQILRYVLNIAKENIKAERGTIYIYEANKQILVSKIFDGDEFKEIRLPIGVGIAGKAALKKKVYNVKNAYDEPEFDSSFDKESGYNTRNLICVPIIGNENNLIGIFQLLNKIKGSFTDDDEEFLKLLSSSAAMAIQNATLYSQVASAEKMSTIGKMSSLIIHDVKNSLAVIHGYASIIDMKIGEDEFLTSQIGKIKDKVFDTNEMLMEILNFAKGQEKLHLRPTSISEILEDIKTENTHDLLLKKIKVSIEIRFEKDFNLDRNQIKRAINNLFINAIQALDKNGNIELVAIEHSKNIEIQIRDDGNGIPVEIRDTLFEPFTTLGKAKGSGLGTAIAKRIVEAHKGSINLETKTDEGTVFKIFLPKLELN